MQNLQKFFIALPFLAIIILASIALYFFAAHHSANSTLSNAIIISGTGIIVVAILGLILNLWITEKSTHVTSPKTGGLTQHKLLQAIDKSGIGIVILDNAGVLLYASPSATSLLNFKNIADPRGHFFWSLDYASQDLNEDRRHNWQSFLQTRNGWEGISRWHGANTLKYYDINVSSIGEQLALVLLIDRTEKVKADQALHQKEEQHNYILDNIPVFISLQDTDLRLIYLNAYLPNLIKKNKDYFYGKVTTDFIKEGGLEEIDDMRHQVINTGAPIINQNFSISKGPLKNTHWLTYIYPVFDAQGQVSQVMTVGLDRTLRQQLQDEKEAYYQKLMETQKIDALNRFAGGLAHELSNLLHPVGTYSKALAENPDDPDRQKHLQKINRAVQQAGIILRRTLTMSRQETDQAAQQKINARLTELISYANDVAPKGLHYRLVLPDEDIIARIDATELRQVLMNLMINAADSQQNLGYVELQLGKGGFPAKLLPMAAMVQAQYGWITITDTGSGMDDVTKSRIFDPFFTTKTGEKGTGLGLALVRSLVRKWGGDVIVSSTIGVGSTFKIWFPILNEDDT
ncbi:MAG: ATP-binding protein [bacterium]